MTAPSFRFADATRRVGPSAIRQLFNLLARPDVVSLAGGFPAQAALDLEGLRDANRRALTHTPGIAFQYGDCAGYLPLRELIAQRESERGLKLDAPHLMITTGSQQAIDLVTRALINPGDCVFVESPTYLGALQAFRFHGANIVPIETDTDGIRIEALEEALVRHQPKMLYLIPNFANPTGCVLSLQRRNAILALAARHRFFVVEDNAYGELYFREPPPPSLLALASDEEREWVVHLASFSKSVAPGLRLAWMTSSASLLEHLTVAKQINDTHAATLSQLVAFHYLNAGSLEPALSRMRAYYQKQANAMQRAIETELADTPLRTQAPAGGMFFWVDLTDKDASALLPRAVAQGVAYVPGAPFYAGDAPAGKLRLSFASASTAEIGEGVRRLGNALREAATPGRRPHQPASNSTGTEQLT